MYYSLAGPVHTGTPGWESIPGLFKGFTNKGFVFSRLMDGNLDPARMYSITLQQKGTLAYIHTANHRQ
jgi:hypothetical protein